MNNNFQIRMYPLVNQSYRFILIFMVHLLVLPVVIGYFPRYNESLAFSKPGDWISYADNYLW